jgi:hypothetical protein
MKYVSMRIPEDGPLGDTFLDANALAIAPALRVKSPLGGWVESVVTLATHRFVEVFLFPAISSLVIPKAPMA